METRSDVKPVYWDNLKGIFISLVVFVNCLYGLQDSALVNTVADVIQVFHMPAFVFATGFLSRGKSECGKGALIRLAAAYLIFNPPMQLYDWFRFGHMLGLLTPVYAYWFLIGMIFWRATAQAVSKVRGALVISIAASLLLGFFGDVTNVLAAARTLAFYPFFLAGFMLPERQLPRLYNKRKVAVHIGGAVLLTLSVTAAYLFVRFLKPSDEMLTMAAYQNVFDLLKRTVMFAVASAAILGFVLAVPNERISGLTTLGSNSMSVFLLHRIFTLLLGDLLLNFGDVARFAGAAAATVALTALLGNNVVASKVDGLLNLCTGLTEGTPDGKSKKALAVKGYIFAAIIAVLLLPLAEAVYSAAIKS